VSATRLPGKPIVEASGDLRLAANVNGPSLIRAPDWLPGRLGTYYLYFAHHKGTSIRLAYADELTGPWRIYEPGVLGLAESRFADHIASPDVHVDAGERQLRLYFHGVLPQDAGRQGTRVAVSSDGLRFSVHPPLLAPRPYLRVFRWRDHDYALAMSGVFWRTADPRRPFEHMPWPTGLLPTLAEGIELDRAGRWPGPLPFRCRHVAVHVVGSELLVVYSMAGDEPERLLYSWVDLSPPWDEWRGSPPCELLAPELPWEGADLPLRPSTFGPAYEPVRELRDPAIFEDADRSLYLVYSIAGEQGLALARLELASTGP
jgi:hypothetical protein